jgi:predicted nucleic acid-binding protein
MTLLDTDIIINMLRERKHEVGAISIITLIEVLRGIEAGKRKRLRSYWKKAST